MSCPKCIQLTSGTPIKTAIQLRRSIEKITDAYRIGILKYEGAGEDGDPFDMMVNDGPWGDFVSNYFSCKDCGQYFHLHAETYHGAGGAFEKVDELPKILS